MYFFKKSSNLSQTHSIRLHRKYEESNFKIKNCLPCSSVFSLMCYTALSESNIATAAREGIFNITADSPTSFLWENAMIIHSGPWEKRPPPSHAMHQGDSICKKQRENVVCVWESPSWANNSVRVERVVCCWLRGPCPKGLRWHWLAALPSGNTLSLEFVTFQHTLRRNHQQGQGNGRQYVPLHSIVCFIYLFIYFFTSWKNEQVPYWQARTKKEKRERFTETELCFFLALAFFFFCAWKKSDKCLTLQSSESRHILFVLFAVFCFE